ncbi:MAG: undecaprenyl/decaprenyl-phosphate alpha-N-acetylglucosaminyl 1-phosphate transferase [Alphaproteobacteria bacterium]|nr:undecaprenyl/decaprenyl-phosphate alpha-N-acetylglucosaminyl 1-phosphate transferase [Alphaproteobacteria bacterium]
MDAGGELAAVMLLATFAGATISLLVCLYANPLAIRLGLMDVPDGRRKVHARATPLIGGLAVILPVLAFGLCQLPLGDNAALSGGLVAAGAAFFVLGLWDDRRHIRPLVRLASSLALFWAVVHAVPSLQVEFLSFSFLNQAVFLEGWSRFFTLLCLVGLINAINMADGKNGLVMGMALIWTCLLLAHAPPELWPLLGCLAAGLAVALAFNLQGALFLGDGGAYALAALLGLLSTHCYGVGFVELPADEIALWFLIPVVDCLRLMASRLLRGHSPFTPDRNHLHHILFRRLSWRWGLVAYLSLVALPAIGANLSPETLPLWAIVSLTAYALLLVGDARALAQPLGVKRALG